MSTSYAIAVMSTLDVGHYHRREGAMSKKIVVQQIPSVHKYEMYFNMDYYRLKEVQCVK